MSILFSAEEYSIVLKNTADGLFGLNHEIGQITGMDDVNNAYNDSNGWHGPKTRIRVGDYIESIDGKRLPFDQEKIDSIIKAIPFDQSATFGMRGPKNLGANVSLDPNICKHQFNICYI